MKKLTKQITLLSVPIVTNVLLLQASVIATSTINCDDSNIPEAVKAASGCNGSGNELPNSIITIINSIIGVLSIVAVIFIIYGGVQYMTSAGDASKAKKAKDTILYACIGLIVCALAFAIVNFAINKFL